MSLRPRMRRHNSGMSLLPLAFALLGGCGGGAELALDPSHLPACAAPRPIAVRWSLPADTALPLQLQVNKAGQPRKPWTSVQRLQGEAATGAWATDGLTISLVDSRGRVLQRRTLTATPCRTRRTP